LSNIIREDKNLKGRDHLGDIRIDRKIILKCIVEE
jgi:hypothetical protein